MTERFPAQSGDTADVVERASAGAELVGIEVSRRGQVVDLAEEQTLSIGELIGIAVAVLVLTLVFRSAR